MAELEAITKTLQRHREDLEKQIDGTSSRRGETAELIGRIEELRRRAEEAQRRFLAAAKIHEARK